MNFLETMGVVFIVILVAPFLATLTQLGRDGVEWRVKIALGWDILFGAFFNGGYKEYISVRVGRSLMKGHKRVIWLGWVIDILFLVTTGQKNHCVESAKQEM